MAIDRPEGLTPLDEAAVAMHEMFCSLQRAGFSHDDALQIVTDLARGEFVEED
ncbi:MAG: hypothetical protein ACOYY2_03945 [Actinomycetota bacterium]